MHNEFLRFQEHLKKKYFSENSEVLQRLSPNLISPFTLQLPKSVLQQAEDITRDLWDLFRSPIYREHIQSDLPFDFDSVPDTPSILSSLDVHINEHNQLKIIEINTNASSYLMNAENYKVRGLQTFPLALETLKESFFRTFGETLAPDELFVVMDENPEKQNLYVEFLMFQQFLQREFSVDCEIADPKDMHFQDEYLRKGARAVAGIYNRHTDFYFSDSEDLDTAYRYGQTLISPNPLTYGLLADKKRFLKWKPELFAELESKEGLALKSLKAALLETKMFSEFDSADELWKQRARYFFKPPNSFGGKSVYRGKSISRTVFQRIYQDQYLAQEIVPASEQTFVHEGQEHRFKYDLRFYFFEGQVQLAAARLYQGQLTNLQTPLGGLTPINFTE